MVVYKQQTFISHILEAGKSRTMMVAGLVCDESPLPDIDCDLSLCPHGVERTRDSSEASF